MKGFRLSEWWGEERRIVLNLKFVRRRN